MRTVSPGRADRKGVGIHEDHLVVDEVARLFRKSPRWVARACEAKVLPFFKVGRNIRFRRDSVAELIRKLESGEAVLPPLPDVRKSRSA